VKRGRRRVDEEKGIARISTEGENPFYLGEKKKIH